MLKIVLVRPGSTDFDEQGRIKGSLSIPLNDTGRQQVERVLGDLSSLDLDVVYCSPCESATETAERLARDHSVRCKTIRRLTNLDHGLWHGKLIEEVRRKQPRVYRECQTRPEEICPPEGETVPQVAKRVRQALMRIIRRHRNGAVAVVVPEPLASILHCMLLDSDLPNLWAVERDTGRWEMIEVGSAARLDATVALGRV